MSSSTKRPAPATRRAGYLIAVAVNAALLYGINVWPGWSAVPFLTDDMELVLEFVNASLVVSMIANAVYVLADPRWLKALGDLLTTVVGLGAMVRLWQVFPFDFGETSFDWALVTRILLVLGIVGGVIGIIAALIALVRSAAQVEAPKDPVAQPRP